MNSTQRLRHSQKKNQANHQESKDHINNINKLKIMLLDKLKKKNETT